jgi:hypothetical protein
VHNVTKHPRAPDPSTISTLDALIVTGPARGDGAVTLCMRRSATSLVAGSGLGAGSGVGAGPGSGTAGVAGSSGAGTVEGSSGAAGVPGSGTAGVTGASGTTGVAGSPGWGTSRCAAAKGMPREYPPNEVVTQPTPIVWSGTRLGYRSTEAF